MTEESVTIEGISLDAPAFARVLRFCGVWNTGYGLGKTKNTPLVSKDLLERERERERELHLSQMVSTSETSSPLT